MSFSKTQTFNEIHQILITKNQGVRVNYIPATDAHSWAQTEMKFAKYWFTKNQGVRANYIPVMFFFCDELILLKQHHCRFADDFCHCIVIDIEGTAGLVPKFVIHP